MEFFANSWNVCRRNFGALLGLWGDFSLNGYRVHVEAAEVEEDVCLESLAVAIAA